MACDENDIINSCPLEMRPLFGFVISFKFLLN